LIRVNRESLDDPDLCLTGLRRLKVGDLRLANTGKSRRAQAAGDKLLLRRQAILKSGLHFLIFGSSPNTLANILHLLLRVFQI